MYVMRKNACVCLLFPVGLHTFGAGLGCWRRHLAVKHPLIKLETQDQQPVQGLRGLLALIEWLNSTSTDTAAHGIPEI